MTQKARNNLMRGLLLFGSVLILVGVFLTWWMLATEEDSSVIEIRLDSDGAHTVEFDHLGLVPGWETRYNAKAKNTQADCKPWKTTRPHPMGTTECRKPHRCMTDTVTRRMRSACLPKPWQRTLYPCMGTAPIRRRYEPLVLNGCHDVKHTDSPCTMVKFNHG